MTERAMTAATPAQAVLQAAPLLAAIAAIVFVRAALGFQFPPPWPDETGFVAPAFDFARTGSFFDPGLNPDRVVMWMPPGYMVVLAGLFRIAGYSFGLARWFSTLCCLASLGLCAWLAWRLTWGWARVLAAWAIGLAFVSPFTLADANIARMDMLLAALMLLALAMSVCGRHWVAAAVVAAGAVVHFNAAYFVAPVLLAAGSAWARRDLRRPDTADIVALGAAAAVLLFYLAHILRNGPGFQADMAFQFTAKRSFGRLDHVHPAWLVLSGAGLAAVAVCRHWRLDGAVACALFGVAFLAMARGGHELWYDYAQPLGFALIAVALLATPRFSGVHDTSPSGRRLGQAGALAAIGLVAAMDMRMTDNIRPMLPSLSMLHRSIVAPADIEKVRRFIATLKPGQTVDFGWSGMELFFLSDLARAGAHWTIVRHSVTERWPLRPADWRVRCDSSDWPAYLLRFDMDHPRAGRDTGCDIFPAGAAN